MGGLKLRQIAAFAAAAAMVAGAALAQAPSAPQAGAAAKPPPAYGIVQKRGQAPVLDGEIPDMAFVVGDLARITAQVSDDIFAAGRDIRVEGASGDHLIAAGGELDLSPAVLHDIIAAGGRIRLRSGVVNDDVVATGGEIELDRNAQVRGSAVTTGARVNIASPIGGSLTAAGDRVELNGPVAHNVRIAATEIVVGPRARIGGDLYVRGSRIQISPEAVVQGQTLRQQVKHDQRPSVAIGLLATLFALGVLLMNGVLASAAPQLVVGLDRGLRSRLLANLGVGALIVVLTPLAIALLAATILGAPLAVVLGLAYLLAIPVAFAGVTYWIGQSIRGRVSRRRAEPPRWSARFGWTVTGAFLLLLACMIPFLGGLVWLAAFAAGVGVLATHLFGRRQDHGQATK